MSVLRKMCYSMASLYSKKANPKNYSPAGQYKLMQMLKKAKRSGDLKHQSTGRCQFNDKYQCTPNACPPLSPLTCSKAATKPQKQIAAKDTARKVLKTKKPLKKEYSVSKQSLARFAAANGYEILNTQGLCAAATASGINRVTVRMLIRQFPPKKPFVRTNHAKFKTGEHTNKKRLAAPIRPSTLKRFTDANGFEIAKLKNMTTAAAASDLSIYTVSKILHQAKCAQGTQT
jgi:hypothetical protein